MAPDAQAISAAGAASAVSTPAAASRPERMQAGIEVDDTTWRDIRTAAETLGITAEAFDQAVGANYSKPQEG